MSENQPGELGVPRLPGSAPGGGQAQGAPSPGMGFTFRPAGREALPGDKLEGGAVSFEDFREDIRRRMGVNTALANQRLGCVYGTTGSQECQPKQEGALASLPTNLPWSC